MKKVVLEPTQLTVVNNNGANSLFATLWDITSSDIQTHEYFCSMAISERIFAFNNVGKFAEGGVPYTYDDGKSSVIWLERLCSLVANCQRNGIEVVIKLDKSAVKATGVTFNYGKQFSEYISNRLIDSYFMFLINLLGRYNLASCISTRCKKLEPFEIKVINDCISVKYEDYK